MAAEPHEDAAFANSVVYTVAVTVRVRGGTRALTAQRRAAAIAERLANHAARAKDALEVTVRAGPSRDGEMAYPQPVTFSAANTDGPSGDTPRGDPPKFDRYRDPDFERALASLAEHNAAYRTWQDADRQRRREVDCANVERRGGVRGRCGCVYCEPDDHYLARQVAATAGPRAWETPPCICRRHSSAGRRCLRHRDVVVVALDGDSDALWVLADTDQPPSAEASS
jgi:hypothetical protein